MSSSILLGHLITPNICPTIQMGFSSAFRRKYMLVHDSIGISVEAAVFQSKGFTFNTSAGFIRNLLYGEYQDSFTIQCGATYRLFRKHLIQPSIDAVFDENTEYTGGGFTLTMIL